MLENGLFIIRYRIIAKDIRRPTQTCTVKVMAVNLRSMHQNRAENGSMGHGSWVMGQMGHENRMGHMGHGSLGVDP